MESFFMSQTQSPLLHIALIADMRNAEQTITLIKSVCFYHPHVIFHVLNQDIHEEWFSILNQYLQQFKCEVVDVTVTEEHLQQFQPLNPSMTLSGYFKFLIPQLIDAERVLYLSHDCIVNGVLDDLYEMDLTDVGVIAVPDLFLNHENVRHPQYPDLKPYFNGQVILFNVALWQQDSPLYPQLLRALQEQQNLSFADQDILNLISHNRWRPADKLYNLQVGVKRLFEEHNFPELGEEAINTHKKSPLIVNYSYIKPWHKWSEDTPYQELYWFYYALEWEELIDRRQSSPSYRLLEDYYR